MKSRTTPESSDDNMEKIGLESEYEVNIVGGCLCSTGVLLTVFKIKGTIY